MADRISGSLFGLLLCDSLGTAVETQPPGSFNPVTNLYGGGKFRLKPGQFTDDGSMALCLAVALLNGTKTNDSFVHPSFTQMNLYRRWYESGYLSSNGECFDIGITVRTAINKFISAISNQTDNNNLVRMEAYYGSTNEKASGNGSLMRLAPVPLLYHRNPRYAFDEAVNSSKTTHGSRLCLDSCRVYTALIIGALQGANKEELLDSNQIYVPHGLPSEYWTASTTLPLDPSVVTVMRGSFKQRDPPQIKASGFVIETLEAALWAFHHTKTFDEGALKVVNLGDDADTAGAVYGMLAGAYYGINAIPIEWRELCSFRGLIQTIADEIWIQSQQGTIMDEKSESTVIEPSPMFKKVMQVYNELAAFHSGTIKRRVLPCPKQYRSSEQFDEDVKQFQTIYENIIQSIKKTDESEELVMNRCDSVFKQFLSLIEEDKSLLMIKWSRNSSHLQIQQRLPTSEQN